MSAFRCSNDHLRALVLYARAIGVFEDDPTAPIEGRASALALAMLARANDANLEFLYGDPPRPPPVLDRIQWPAGAPRIPTVAHPDARLRSIVVALKLIACFEYQSSDAPTWPDSEARKWCDALRNRLIRELPGYEAAPWGM